MRKRAGGTISGFQLCSACGFTDRQLCEHTESSHRPRVLRPFGLDLSAVAINENAAVIFGTVTMQRVESSAQPTSPAPPIKAGRDRQRAYHSVRLAHPLLNRESGCRFFSLKLAIRVERFGTWGGSG